MLFVISRTTATHAQGLPTLDDQRDCVTEMLAFMRAAGAVSFYDQSHYQDVDAFLDIVSKHPGQGQVGGATTLTSALERVNSCDQSSWLHFWKKNKAVGMKLIADAEAHNVNLMSIADHQGHLDSLAQSIQAIDAIDGDWMDESIVETIREKLSKMEADWQSVTDGLQVNPLDPEHEGDPNFLLQIKAAFSLECLGLDNTADMVTSVLAILLGRFDGVSKSFPSLSTTG